VQQVPQSHLLTCYPCCTLPALTSLLSAAAYNEPNRSPIAAAAAFNTYDSFPGGGSARTNSLDFNIAYFVTDPDGDFLMFGDISNPVYGVLEPLQLPAQFANTWWRYTPKAGIATGGAVVEQLCGC
jgi:hypothetical protein